MRKNTLNLRKQFESLMDKDEIGGPNDKYQQIANDFLGLSRLWYCRFAFGHSPINTGIENFIFKH
jgi:hypothetical protein